MNKENWLLIGILFALILGLTIGYLTAQSKYSKEIKGLEYGFKTSCEGMNAIILPLNQLSYLTGIYTPQLDCEELVEGYRNKYK